LGLKLTPEGFLDGFAKLFGAQDVKVGDAQFDADVRVKGTNPQRIREFLTPARTFRLHRLLKSYPGLEINDDELRWDASGLFRDAWFLTGEREQDRAMSLAIIAQDQGRPEEAIEFLESRRGSVEASVPDETPIRREPPPRRLPETAESPATPADVAEEPFDAEPVEERLLEGELLYLAGKRAEAKKVFDRALEGAGDDAEIRDWAERASRTPVEVKPDPSVDVDLGAGAVCGVLFDPKNSSLDADRIFEERYEGRTVNWSGVLQKTESYSYDFVLGNGPGTKAVVEVYELPSALYGGKKVLAVVAFPEDAAGSLEDAGGKPLEFEASLLKVDGFMRNLYLADGKLSAF